MFGRIKRLSERSVKEIAPITMASTPLEEYLAIGLLIEEAKEIVKEIEDPS